MAMMWLVYLSFLLRLTWSVRQNMSEKKNVNPKEWGRQNAAILMRAYVHCETDVFVMCHSKWISWVPDSEFFLLIHKWMNLFGFFSVENYSSSVEFEEKNTQQLAFVYQTTLVSLKCFSLINSVVIHILNSVFFLWDRNKLIKSQ